MRIAIAAGHGRTGSRRWDPGAVNKAGLKEHDVCVAIVQELGLLVAGEEEGQAHWKHFNARPNWSKETALEVLDVFTVASPTTLEDKVAVVNMQHDRQAFDLVVEIHTNSHGDPTANGTEVLYYSRRNENTAATISRVLSEAIETRDRGPKRRSDLFWLRKTKPPAVLIEVLFISNLAEAAKISREEFIATTAGAIASGIKEAMSWKDVLKTVAKVGSVVTGVDEVIDAVRDSQSTGTETDKIVRTLEEVKTVALLEAARVTEPAKKPLQSKKFIAGLGGLITIGAGLVAGALGVDAELVSDAIEKVVALIMAYLAAQGTADAVKAIRK